MKKLRSKYSEFKSNLKSKLKKQKTSLQTSIERAREALNQAKTEPKSDRRYFALGFATALGIFGAIKVAPILPALAKDLPKRAPDPKQVAPAPAPAPKPSENIIQGLAGAAAMVSSIAVKSGPFFIGAACGLVVAVGILKAQGK